MICFSIVWCVKVEVRRILRRGTIDTQSVVDSSGGVVEASAARGCHKITSDCTSWTTSTLSRDEVKTEYFTNLKSLIYIKVPLLINSVD